MGPDNQTHLGQLKREPSLTPYRIFARKSKPAEARRNPRHTDPGKPAGCRTGKTTNFPPPRNPPSKPLPVACCSAKLYTARINSIPLTPSPPTHPSIQNAELTQTIRGLGIELVLQQPLGNPNLIWDGVTLSKTFSALESIHRHSLFNAAEQSYWTAVLRDGSRINETLLDSSSFDTMLHQAASHGAPLRVVRKIVVMGAWRTLRNARGQKPVDVARSLGHTHLVDALEPVCRRSVPEDLLRQIEANFHDGGLASWLRSTRSGYRSLAGVGQGC
ncbi:hypothetical protein BC938DRAFT_479634 [Jimgerdemannia flammicorona]|uniref:Uncharacterized protein n=1 Tax=Jimgerdemannia flammicorona TaxID=994334 RepID=A0A433QKH5_9FUNG|nr:hypothetical protein BC938DRAFT_479634 [Jimgerdemannia flammicorona]